MLFLLLFLLSAKIHFLLQQMALKDAQLSLCYQSLWPQMIMKRNYR